MLEIITTLWLRIKGKTEPLTSEDAYTLKKYGKRMDEAEVLSDALSFINDCIKMTSKTYVVFEYDFTYPDMRESITKYYTNLGYHVLHIKEEYMSKPKLMISWER